jgi:ubiquinol-cytochrome c reductase cytochrome b subunit
MIVRRTARFFDDRFGTNAGVRFVLSKIYPDHWSFYLGEFALYAFILLVATGIWLTFIYDAAPDRAFASVDALSRATPIGYLVRQVHHWSADFFVAAIVVHMGRIFFTAAYRAPREINYVVGLTMLVLASLTGFTGYSLPNDSLSGTGLRIADSVTESVPFVGGWVASVFNGGAYPGPQLLSHLYTAHVYFLPVTIAALLSLHLGMLIYQKHTQFVRDPRHVVGRRFWPDYALRTLAAFAATIAVILILAATVEINPIAHYGLYHDWTVPNPATPDWYAALLDGGLRLGPSTELLIFGHPIPPVFWPGVVLPSLAFGFLYAWPWIDRWWTRDEAAWHDVLVPPSLAPHRVGVGVTLLAAAVVLTLAASDDQLAMVLHVPVVAVVWFYRILFPLGSLAAGLVAALIARELAARRARFGMQRERVVALVRNAQGGFDEVEPETT